MGWYNYIGTLKFIEVLQVEREGLDSKLQLILSISALSTLAVTLAPLSVM